MRVNYITLLWFKNIYLILDFFNSGDDSSGHDSDPVLCSRGSADTNGHQGCY